MYYLESAQNESQDVENSNELRATIRQLRHVSKTGGENSTTNSSSSNSSSPVSSTAAQASSTTASVDSNQLLAGVVLRRVNNNKIESQTNVARVRQLVTQKVQIFCVKEKRI